MNQKIIFPTWQINKPTNQIPDDGVFKTLRTNMLIYIPLSFWIYRTDNEWLRPKEPIKKGIHYHVNWTKNMDEIIIHNYYKTLHKLITPENNFFRLGIKEQGIFYKLASPLSGRVGKFVLFLLWNTLV